MLSAENPNDVLKARAQQYFYRKLKQKSIKVTTACFAGFSLILLSAVFMGLLSIWTILASIVVAAIAGFTMILQIFPTKANADESFGLMLQAVDDPSIIKASSLTKVTLDSGDKSVTLDPIFLDVWVTIIAPHLFSSHNDTLKEIRRNSARVHRDTQIGQNKIKEQMVELRQKQAQINVEESKLKDREEQLTDAESLLIDQLTEIERTQEELAVMRMSLEESVSDADNSDGRLEELEAKEIAVAKMEAQLREDRAIVEAQKTELNQLKGELIAGADQDSSSGEDTIELKQRIVELEEAKGQLEERSAYVQSVEDQLIDQLNALTEREAIVEQREADSGLRAG